MIRIVRPINPPRFLLKKGSIENKKNCDSFSNNQASFIKTFKADPKIYGNTQVKKTLKRAQYNKCCFCEKNQVDEFGAVEHFRPKSGYKIDKNQKKLTKPGYYWLTYEWNNLLFVCGACNTSHKKNFFPLVDESKRAKSHLHSIDEEESYLLDPCGPKDPKDHLSFHGASPMPLSPFGRKTIEICGLHRDSLDNLRLILINNLEARLLILSAKNQYSEIKVEQAKKYIIDAQSPESEFSAVARNYLAKFNLVYT